MGAHKGRPYVVEAVGAALVAARTAVAKGGHEARPSYVVFGVKDQIVWVLC